MKPAPFEQFIKSLLDNSAAKDALRDLTKRNLPIQGSSLMSAVDAILLEESIAAQFDIEGYDSNDKKVKVLDKLLRVRNLLDRNLVIPDNADYITVQLCIQYVENGYALTSTSLDCLNKIYKKYNYG